MLLRSRCRSLSIYLALPALAMVGANRAYAQGAPDAPPTPPPPPGDAEVIAPTDPRPTDPAASRAQPDPALVRVAREAKAAGRVLEVDTQAAVKGCAEIGHTTAAATAADTHAREIIRAEIRGRAIMHHATHIWFHDFTTGFAQRESAEFYDCAPGLDSPPASSVADELPLLMKGSGSQITDVPIMSGPRGAVAVQLELVPGGTLRVGGTDEAAGTTIGVSIPVDYFASPHLAFGVLPGVVFGLSSDGSPPATQLDLRARCSFGRFTGDGFAVRGYVTMGESWIVASGMKTSSGVTAGFGIAASYPLRGSQFVTLDLGYQLGYQTATEDRVELDFSTNLLRLGLGLGSYF